MVFIFPVCKFTILHKYGITIFGKYVYYLFFKTILLYMYVYTL